jgi:hypothetical protein
MHYKGTDKPLPEIAQELNMDGIVEGSVLRAGGRVRITAQLIEAATDQHIWVMLELDPNGFWTHLLLAHAFQSKEMWAETWAERKKAFVLMGNSEVAEAGDHGFSETGYQGAMQAVGWKLVEQSKKRYIPPADIADIFAVAGELEQSLYWVEKAFEERDPKLVWRWGYPHWAPLRSDPRFRNVLRRMNFPEQ